MPWIIAGICLVSTIICIIKLQKKQQLDKSEINKLEQDVQLLKHNKDTLREDLRSCQEQIEKEQKRFQHITEEDNRILAQKAAEVDEFYNKAKARRLEQIENEANKTKELLQQNIQQETQKCEDEVQQIKLHFQNVKDELNNQMLELVRESAFQHEKFESLLAPLQQYEKEKQDKLFYTVQVPEEYHDDIDYLLTDVAAKIQHPDIVNKLVWSEYIKPYLDETFKRVGIEAKSGIYKITNIETNKAYIGKSTDIKKRLADHFKGSCGIKSIADQTIHHAMLKEGLWNWSIEYITYCEKERLNELEKYYIDFFNTQTYGFNKNSGGGG